MKASEVKEFAFWKTIYESDYDEGVKMAKNFLERITQKQESMTVLGNDTIALDNTALVVSNTLEDVDELKKIFTNERLKPDCLKEEDLPENMPEADSY